MSEAMMITQTEHRRLTAEVDEEGVLIRETSIEGTRMPSQAVWVTKQEFAKIAKRFVKRPPSKKATVARLKAREDARAQ